MTYDANGNPTRVENDSTAAVRELYWDEDNRLMVLSDNVKPHATPTLMLENVLSRATAQWRAYISMVRRRALPSMKLTNIRFILLR